MSRHRVTVVLSQAQGKNPARRSLEESVTAALIMEPGLDVSIIPYLYDLDAKHTGRMFLEAISGDMVLLGWMYPRAAFWCLDRGGIKGQYGENAITPAPKNDDEDGEPEPPKGIGAVDVPPRWIYCLDLRDHTDHTVYVNEVKRIAEECRTRREQQDLKQWIKGSPNLIQLGRYLKPDEQPRPEFAADDLLKQPGRRWYPVIDYSRCTNCMECLDFCLFGVYGVDGLDRLTVENQDNCKKGCPACSRVCPEHAIMFPDYKSAAIAGAPVAGPSGLKIDLTKLFGGGDSLAMAAAERDAELVKDGRDAVGLAVGIPKRQEGKSQGPKDDLDQLMDALDELEI